MHVYYLRNLNASDNPNAADFASLTVRMFDADYRSTDASGTTRVSNGISRDSAALYLRRARERGWHVQRYFAE